MNYGSIIRQAWAITWRYRFLWLLGVLTGGAVGVPSLGGGGGGNVGWRVQSDDLQRAGLSASGLAASIGDWMAANVALLLTLAAIGAGVLVLLIVLSFIAQGGLTQATADLASGRPSSLGRAWTAGLHFFWRYVGLWLALVVAAIAVAFVIAVVVAAIIGALSIGQTLIGVALAIVAVPMFILLLVAALAMSIVVAFAQRAIAIENVGPVDALRSGWQMARSHLGESFLTWLVNLGLALVSGVVFLLVVVGTLALLVGVGAVLVGLAGFSTPTIVYTALAGLLFLAAVLVVAGMANAFFWTFWTLVYLRLRGTAAT